MWQLKSETIKTCEKQHPEKQQGINASLHESRSSPNATEMNQALNEIKLIHKCSVLTSRYCNLVNQYPVQGSGCSGQAKTLERYKNNILRVRF